MHTSTTDPRVHSTLPRPWEREIGFHETLYDWMERAPWMGISAAFHLLAFFVLSAIPWEQFRDREPVVIQARATAPPELPEEEPPEPPPEPVPTETLVDPQLVDALVTEELDVVEAPVDSLEDFLDTRDALDDAGIIGLGDGGPKLSGRRRGRGPGKGAQATERAVRDGLEWLRAHQSPRRLLGRGPLRRELRADRSRALRRTRRSEPRRRADLAGAARLPRSRQHPRARASTGTSWPRRCAG